MPQVRPDYAWQPRMCPREQKLTPVTSCTMQICMTCEQQSTKIQLHRSGKPSMQAILVAHRQQRVTNLAFA